MLATILSIVLIAVCVVANAIILKQEGKTNGLGSLGGGPSNMDSYWMQNKGRSAESRLVKATVVMVVAIFALSIILNIV